MTDTSTEQAPTITREMIALYDDYTHLSLDRRKFMDNLAKLAGSMPAAMAAAALMAGNAKAAGRVAEDDPRLSAETVTWAGATGEMTGYLISPRDVAGPMGGVVVVHENRGLNAHIRDVARRVALEGFVALAPDFLSPLGGTPADEDAARNMFGNLDRGMVTANAVSAVTRLAGDADSNGKVGAVGFCWGGGTVNALAVAAPVALKAAVAYYGAQPPVADVARIKARLMLHYAGLDDRINAGITAFRSALDAAGTDYQLFVYDGVNHAFNNDTSAARYDKAAADRSWGRTIGLFKETL